MVERQGALRRDLLTLIARVGRLMGAGLPLPLIERVNRRVKIAKIRRRLARKKHKSGFFQPMAARHANSLSWSMALLPLSGLQIANTSCLAQQLVLPMKRPRTARNCPKHGSLTSSGIDSTA